MESEYFKRICEIVDAHLEYSLSNDEAIDAAKVTVAETLRAGLHPGSEKLYKRMYNGLHGIGKKGQALEKRVHETYPCEHLPKENENENV